MSCRSFSLCMSPTDAPALAVVSVFSCSCAAAAPPTANSTIARRPIIRSCLSAGVRAGDGIARVARPRDVGDQSINYLRRREHARQPRAGMGPRADEVEPVDLFGLVVEAE